jgi:hypothetical protein
VCMNFSGEWFFLFFLFLFFSYFQGFFLIFQIFLRSEFLFSGISTEFEVDTSRPMSDGGGLLCRVCRSTRLREDEDTGALFCQTCGALSQDVANESLDFEAGRTSGHGQRFRRAGRGGGCEHDFAGTASELTFRATRLFFDCYQQLLMHQVSTLVHRFGCSAKLVSVVGRVWVCFLDHWHQRASDMRVRLNSTNTLLRKQRGGADASGAMARKRRRRGGNADPDEPADTTPVGDDDDDVSANAGSAPREEDAALLDLNSDPAYHFPMSLSLALQLMALALIREPVSARDLVRWALSGELPFFGFSAHLPMNSASLGADKDIFRFFSPQTVWNATSLQHFTAAELAPLLESR